MDVCLRFNVHFHFLLPLKALILKIFFLAVGERVIQYAAILATDHLQSSESY